MKEFTLNEVNALIDDLLHQEFIDFPKEIGPFGWNKVREWKAKNNLTPQTPQYEDQKIR